MKKRKGEPTGTTTKSDLWKLQAKTVSRQSRTNKVAIDSALILMDSIEKMNFSKEVQDVVRLFVMSIFKSISMINSAKSLDYKNENVELSMNDPFSTVNILRAQFEAFCNFNNLLIQSSTMEEFKLKCMVWKMYGIDNRQKYPNPKSEEFQRKKEQDKKEIDALKTAIKNNACFKCLTSTKKDSICNPNNDWKLIIDNHKFRFAPYSELFELSEVKIGNELHTQYYRYLSSNAHPSYFSVMQFKDVMKTKKTRNNMMVHLLQMSDALLSCFIVDLCRYSSDIKNCFDKLPKVNRWHIGTLNKAYRPSIDFKYESS